MRTIAITNQKGGCGKTTTAVNLAASLAELGKKTLIVDLDPQGHSTIGFGYDPDELGLTVHDVIINPKISFSEIIFETQFECLDIAPSNVLLSGAEIELTGIAGREFVLSEKLRAIADNYDISVIDCPPSLSLLTLNALVASTDVVVPVQVQYYAMEGLKQLFETAEIIKERFHPCYVKILGLLLTFVEDKILLSRQIQRQMRAFFGDLVFDTVIHRSVRLAESPSSGEPVLTYAPRNKAAAEYRALAEEIINDETFTDLNADDKAFSQEMINVKE